MGGRQGQSEGKEMDSTVRSIFEGRMRKVLNLPKNQAYEVVKWLSENEGQWEEAQVFDHIKDSFPRGLVKGTITFFCRCFKDSRGRAVFTVEGRRPRTIRYLPPSER